MLCKSWLLVFVGKHILSQTALSAKTATKELSRLANYSAEKQKIDVYSICTGVGFFQFSFPVLVIVGFCINNFCPTS